MAENSGIEWTDHTFNPWMGCTKISPGCDHCYAEQRMDKRLHVVNWGPGAPRKRTSEKNWNDPVKWNANHEAFFAQHGRRQRVFCASLADVFDNEVPVSWRADLLALINETPNLDWLLLTKRIGNVERLLREALVELGNGTDALVGAGLPPNVWLGATIVNQEEADRDIPKLLAVPAARRFLSMEPLLGPVGLTHIPIGGGHGHHELEPVITANVLKRATAYPPLPKLDWVIVGGESGPGARPMHPDWVRSLRYQCKSAGAPFFFKQWGEWCVVATDFIDQRSGAKAGNLCRVESISQPDHYVAVSADRLVRYMLQRVGKKAAGRLLDGETWSQVPQSATTSIASRAATPLLTTPKGPTMNAPLPTITIPALGAQLEGGFFHGVVLIDGQLWGEVTGPKAECHVSGLAWHPDFTDIAGATSDFDGLANTRAMAAAGSPLAQAALACRSGGFDDWAIPARGSQLMQWGNLKPLLSAAEAFAPNWHWSSTQFSRYTTFYQYFNYGHTDHDDKSWDGGCARFVRRFPLGH